MADDINKKITIEVEVSSDGQNQLNQYKSAFKDLKTSINDLGQPLSDLSKTISSLDKSFSNISNSGDQVKAKISEVSSSFSVLNTIAKATGVLTDGIGTAISGVLSLLITFGPEIIKWIGNLLKGDTTLKSLNQTLREHKLILQAVNEARLKGDQNAQQELVHLKTLYKASQDQNLSLIDRKKIVKELQSQYPDYFSNLSSEAILTGKAAKAYNDLATAIIASARAKASEDALVQNSKRQLDDADKIKTIRDQIADKKQELATVEKAFREQERKADRGRGAINDDDVDKMQQLRDEINGLQKTIYDASNDSRILDKKNQALATDITTNTEKNGAKTITTINNQTAALSKYSKELKEVSKHQSSAQTGLQLAFSTPNAQSPDPTLDNEEQETLNKSVNTQPTADDLKQIKFQQDLQRAKDEAKQKADIAKEKAIELKDFEIQTAKQVSSAAFSILQNSIKQQADAKIASLESQKASELNNTSLTASQRSAIEARYKKQEDQVKLKAFKKEQEAALAQAVINGALAITKATSQTGVLSPFVVPEIIAETAIEIAKIASQKPPAFASGGLHYTSDGRGGVLPGYSRSDNTNAFLRSGEAVVVSEAMRAPWARNLVSAINVGFGGRDFSTSTKGRGYAVGGVFTDGGDANRYYNAPVNDQKNLANTIAYQMINNFPPVYVDVKDINNQQNILAQTINRVNL